MSDADDVYFNASATSDPSCSTGIASYTFSFGDGTSSVSTYAYAYHYFHVATGSQTFPVKLTVLDTCGQSNSFSMSETVEHDAGPAAVLTVTNSSANPYTVYADASASTSTAPAYTYEYEFSWGDGTSNVTYAPHAAFSHTYASSGSEAVTVDVFDDAGLDNSKTQTVSVPFAPPPTSPSNVTANPGDTKATVKWAPPTSGGTPSQYVISTYANDSFLTTRTFPGTNTRATVTGLTDGTTYSFTVTAVVGGVRSAPSQRSNPVLPVGKPASPTLVNAVQDDTAAVVQWAAPTREGSKPLSYHQGINYTVTTNPAVVKPISVTGDPAPTNVTIPGLTPGDYTFTVTASTVTAANTTLTSAPSNPSPSVTLDPQGPTLTEQPQLKLIEPSTVGTSANNLPVTVNVVWTASPGAAGSTPECGFDLRRSLNNGTWVDETPTLLTTMSFDDTVPVQSPPYVVRYEVGIVTSSHCATSSTWVYSGWSQSSQFAGRELPDTSTPKFSYSTGWTQTTCSNCTDGEDMVTTTKGATVTLTLNSAFNVGLIFTAGPGLGSVSVKVTLADGTSVTKTRSTAESPQAYRQLLFKTGWGMFQAATITVTTLSTAAVDFDGAVVLYAPLARLGS